MLVLGKSVFCECLDTFEIKELKKRNETLKTTKINQLGIDCRLSLTLANSDKALALETVFGSTTAFNGVDSLFIVVLFLYDHKLPQHFLHEKNIVVNVVTSVKTFEGEAKRGESTLSLKNTSVTSLSCGIEQQGISEKLQEMI
uniref:Uncharacterized protein n=1 Tax=Romanomermis culicivorax TaxID=13658 RepID=A0A915JPP9_ROMCU